MRKGASMPKRKSVRRGRMWEGSVEIGCFNISRVGCVEWPRWMKWQKVRVRIIEILPKKAAKKGKKK